MAGSFEAPFRKLHGCGNSFVILLRAHVPNLRTSGEEFRAWVTKICHPGWGIGSDGLFVLGNGSGGSFDVEMFNPDGSHMGMCGNGSRCLVKFLALEGMLPDSVATIWLRIDGGIAASGERRVTTLRCQTEDGGDTVSVEMSEPVFAAERIPVRSSTPQAVRLEVDGGRTFEAFCVSVGNPHAIIFVEGGGRKLAREIGPLLEVHPAFPERCNISFVTVESSKLLRFDVWERGAGITLACGSAASAVAIAARKQGFCPGPLTVSMPGGNLAFDWKSGSERPWMTGPTQVVCRGHLEVPESLLSAS